MRRTWASFYTFSPKDQAVRDFNFFIFSRSLNLSTLLKNKNSILRAMLYLTVIVFHSVGTSLAQEKVNITIRNVKKIPINALFYDSSPYPNIIHNCQILKNIQKVECQFKKSEGLGTGKPATILISSEGYACIKLSSIATVNQIIQIDLIKLIENDSNKIHIARFCAEAVEEFVFYSKKINMDYAEKNIDETMNTLYNFTRSIEIETNSSEKKEKIEKQIKEMEIQLKKIQEMRRK